MRHIGNMNLNYCNCRLRLVLAVSAVFFALSLSQCRLRTVGGRRLVAVGFFSMLIIKIIISKVDNKN